MTQLLAPPLTPAARFAEALRERGHAVLDPAGLGAIASTSVNELEHLRASWNDLPADAYLRDGGRYRRRRHGCFIAEAGALLICQVQFLSQIEIALKAGAKAVVCCS